VDWAVLEAKLGTWAEGLLGEAPCPEAGEEAIAIDGKSLRGIKKQGAPGVHLLSALAHRVGVTLAQQAVDDKTNEIPGVLDLLHHLVLEGRIVTMDALLTQRQIAQQIVDAGGHYVMVVQENQPSCETILRPCLPCRRGRESGARWQKPWTWDMAASSSAGGAPVTC
jgi:hypothetical protein